MKYQEINALTIQDINSKLLDEEANLRKLTFAHAISPIENPLQIRKSRRQIAKFKTCLRAKELNPNENNDGQSKKS